MIPILYKDEYFCICEKPPGIVSETPGLPELVSSRIGTRLYPVHRLDQGTGGVCVMAFSSQACNAAMRLFQSGNICKQYLAVVSGSPGSDSGTYTDLLFHDQKGNKTYVVNSHRKGVRDAVCDWKLVSSASWYDHPVLSLIRVELHSGRTHQIRVQFSHRGLPLVGDRKYGSRVPAEYPSLWAESISFKHPYIKGKIISARSSPPDRFPWNLFDF